MIRCDSMMSTAPDRPIANFASEGAVSITFAICPPSWEHWCNTIIHRWSEQFHGRAELIWLHVDTLSLVDARHNRV